MPFQVNGQDPPDGGVPRGPGSVLHKPQATGSSGSGIPCGAVGKWWFETTFNTINKTAAEWWLAILAGATYVSLTSFQVWNPYKSGGAGWQTFTSGVLHDITYSGTTYGGAYQSFRILVTELE